MTPLEARVMAVNEAHAYAAKLSVTLRELFRPLVGCKILKADGTLLKSVKETLPETLFPSTPRLHVYRNVSDYSLGWMVKTCVTDERSHGNYYEVAVYVGDLGDKWTGQGQVLAKLNETPFAGRTDYTAADIQAKRERYKELQKLADDAKSAIYPFDLIDR